ncbi:MAG TPA: response regulator transcription factor, partial [Micromonosporaceae bacterium]
MPHVLVVEDDATLRTALLRALTDRGYATSSAPTGMSGLSAAIDNRPDLVVLDLGLPDVDGSEVLRMLRAVSAVPVIVATAREDEGQIVRALDAGADDYLTKPFGIAQLDARIRAVMRRATTGETRPPEIVVGGLVIDPAAHTAVLDGTTLDLSAREFDLL